MPWPDDICCPKFHVSTNSNNPQRNRLEQERHKFTTPYIQNLLSVMSPSFDTTWRPLSRAMSDQPSASSSSAASHSPILIRTVTPTLWPVTILQSGSFFVLDEDQEISWRDRARCFGESVGRWTSAVKSWAQHGSRRQVLTWVVIFVLFAVLFM